MQRAGESPAPFATKQPKGENITEVIKMKTCENNGCNNLIEIPSLDCPGQCLSCAVESRERVRIALEQAAKDKTK